MKKYVAAVLIPWLLLQLCGCYSFRNATFNEIKNYNGPNQIRVRTNGNELLLERKSGILDSMDWKLSDSSIIIETKEQVKRDLHYELTDKTAEINLSEIETAEMKEFDLLKSSRLILTMGAIIAAAIAGSKLSRGIGMSAK